MIKSFKHKGLKQLFEKGIASGIPAQDAERINDRLINGDAYILNYEDYH